MVVPVVAIPVPQFIHTEAEISAFTEFDTYVKIFEGKNILSTVAWEEIFRLTINC